MDMDGRTTSDSDAGQRQLDVQVIMAADKEHVLSQKRASASWGVEIPVGYSEVISSKSYAGDFEARRARGGGKGGGGMHGVYVQSHAHTTFLQRLQGRRSLHSSVSSLSPPVTNTYHTPTSDLSSRCKQQRS